MQRDNAPLPEVSESILPEAEDPLPSPAEQADSLVLWIGAHQLSSAQTVDIPESKVSAWIGTAITSNNRNEELTWLLQQPEMERLLEKGTAIGGPIRLRLTFAGWERYEALKRAEVESRRAFMAMQFGNEELNRIVNDAFKPAVAKTGFELRLLTERQPAGLIDDQLRVALNFQFTFEKAIELLHLRIMGEAGSGAGMLVRSNSRTDALGVPAPILRVRYC
jgi:hypothetical protein